MIYRKKTKIIATLGPACDDEKILTKMIRSGVDIIRLNASHQADPDVIKRQVKLIRHCSDAIGKPVGVFLDLQGPKIRVGKFSEGKVSLKTGAKFTLHAKKQDGDETGCSVSYKQLITELQVGDSVFLDDGKIRLKVLEKKPGQAICKVVQGGVLSNHKGMNIPDTDLSVSALTPKDLKDLELLTITDIDCVALSFVSQASDIKLLRRKLDALGCQHVRIIAKIERQSAVKNLESIMAETNVVMVARGDLGVEVGIEAVPEIQKRIIRLANTYIKPVIVATQMLESMVQSKVATRAEVSDVANAIYDRCDAVMLSGETATGIDPAHVVKTMNDICVATDHHLSKLRKDKTQIQKNIFENKTVATSICKAADLVAEENSATAILSFSSSGNTPLIHSKLNPMIAIFGLTDDVVTLRRMTFYRGVIPIILSTKFEDMVRWRDMIAFGIKTARNMKLIKENDILVVTAGIPIGQSGGVNSIRIVKAADT